MTAYSMYAIDEQSCKDHNGRSLEGDIKAKVNESFIGELKNYELLWGFDNAVSGVILMNFSIAVMRYHDSERRMIALINKQLVSETIGQLRVKHLVSSDVRPNELTLTHETNIPNRYGVIVDHVSAAVVSAFQSVVHAYDMNPFKKD